MSRARDHTEGYLSVSAHHLDQSASDQDTTMMPNVFQRCGRYTDDTGFSHDFETRKDTTRLSKGVWIYFINVS